MGVIHKGLSSKTATHESQVHNHVVSCYSHFFTDIILHPVRCLYRSPYLQFISLVMCNTIQWLHTIMRLIRSLINHVNLLFCIIQNAEKKIDVVYQTPYQSHYCMEPLNCVAHYQGDKLEIWGPIQAPDWVQDYISKEMGIARDNVIVNLTFMGGGFGRKAFMDYPHEASVISKEVGAPVQVVWTREDDATQGPYRPGITYRCEGVVTNGEISAFKLRMAGQNNDHWRGGDKTKPNRSTSEGFLKPYFETIQNLSIADVPFET